MKTAKEIYVDNRKRTVIECQSCGATTYVKAGIDTKRSKAAIARSCKLVNLLRTYRLIKVGGKSLVLIRTHMFMVPCHGYEQVLDTGWRKRDVWDGWRGFGMTSTKKSGKVFNHNHQQIIKTNLSMSNYLDQLREQVRLKQLGVKEPQKQSSGLPSIYDYIDTSTKDSKK